MGLAWCPLVLEKKCELTNPHNFGSRNPSVSTESKFHLRPLWKITKKGLAWCPLVLKKKCELTTPHYFGSRNPSVSTKIKITPSAIMKKQQNGSSLVSIGPREKVRIKDPQQFWVKESICVNGIKISPLAIKKKHQNGSSLVSIGPREKERINDPPQSKFHLRPLWKSTKIGLAWCPLVLEKKCKLTTSHNFGSRNQSLSKEIKISPSKICTCASAHAKSNKPPKWNYSLLIFNLGSQIRLLLSCDWIFLYC